MKYLSILFFALSFAWTWNIIHSDENSSITHVALQNQIIEHITNAIKAKKPNATNLEITKIYSEQVKASKIKTSFSYKYSDKLENGEELLQNVDGYALLSLQGSDESENELWKIEKIHLANEQIEFSETILVNPYDKDEDPSETADSSQNSTSDQNTTQDKNTEKNSDKKDNK